MMSHTLNSPEGERPQDLWNTLNGQAAGVILDKFGLQPSQHCMFELSPANHSLPGASGSCITLQQMLTTQAQMCKAD